jgi:hypothetical protein
MGFDFDEVKKLTESDFYIYESDSDREMVRAAIKEFQS